MHIDLSVVPAAYSEAATRYPVVVNGAAVDIRRRHVSRNLVSQEDDWKGPIIIKTDLNFSGTPEKNAAERFRRDGRPSDMAPGPIVSTTRLYPVLPSASEVPADVWANPGFVVQRFLPEQDQHGYWLRAWVFFGDRDRCTKGVAEPRRANGERVAEDANSLGDLVLPRRWLAVRRGGERRSGVDRCGEVGRNPRLAIENRDEIAQLLGMRALGGRTGILVRIIGRRVRNDSIMGDVPSFCDGLERGVGARRFAIGDVLELGRDRHDELELTLEHAEQEAQVPAAARFSWTSCADGE
jgi:hypothetical protein